MSTVYKSSQVTFQSTSGASVLLAPADSIVSSIYVADLTSGNVTIELKKGASAPQTLVKTSTSGEVLQSPFVAEAGDQLIVTPSVTGVTVTVSYAYSASVSSDLSINALLDVDITGIQDNQVLQWDDALQKFLPATGGTGGGASVLNDLGDVDVTSPSTGHFLIHDGNSFKNRLGYGTDLKMSTSDNSTITLRINQNASDISTLETEVANAATLIDANTSGITANAAAISNNDTDILNLTNQLNTANANIASNDSDIATLQTDISDAGTLININAVDIATNTANISNNGDDIQNLQTSVNTNAGYITDINNGVGNVIAVKVDGEADITGTVTLAQGPNVTLTQSGNTITIDSSGGGGGGGGHSFGTIAVSGQADVVAESGNDTLNFTGGTGITITTDAGTDTVTFAADTSVLATDAELASLATSVAANTVDIASNDGEIAILQAATHVNKFNNLTGDVTISGGNGITLTPSGNDIEIASTATSTTINNNAAGRIITGSNTADTLNAETTLSWVSNTLLVAGDAVLTGDITAVEANVGTINYSKQITIQTPSSTFPAQGELSPIAGTGLTAGQLYYLNSSGVWTIADATTEASCKNMLGIAISATEVMIRGHLSYPAYAGFSDGEPLYVKPSSTGDITNIIPSASGHIVRKVGFSLDGSVRSIYFNPSNDYFEVE